MSKGENAKLPRNFNETEMMRMMFGEEFLLASNDNFEELNEESEIFKDIFFKNGIETVSQTGFEIISNSHELILDKNNNNYEILEPRPLEFETLAFNVDDSSINHDININIISQNGNFDPHIISQNGNFDPHIISQNSNFALQNGNLIESHINNNTISENLYMGPSEVDLYATIGGNLGTSSDNFIESDPLEFDHEIALHGESTDEEQTTEPVYGNICMENERNNISFGPLEYDLDLDHEIHNHSYALSTGEEKTNQESQNREPKSLSKDLSDQLRAHANRVLTEAGWQIDPRKRSDRAKLASYYKFPPHDLIFTTFSKAWRTCGEILAVRLAEVKEWGDVSTFWVDLAESMSRIWRGQSLGDKWRVLDPFVAVVCVDKKVHVLRSRGVVRVVGGECVVVSEGRRKREKVVEERERDFEGCNNHEGKKSNKGRRVKRKKCHCGDKGCADDYNNNYNHIRGNDDNVGFVECEFGFGFNGEGNYMNNRGERLEFKLNDSVDMDHIDYEIPRSPMGTKLVNNSIKKARKRSKRISEIDAPETNGENSDIKPPKKPRSSETKPKARRFPKTELPETDFPGNKFPENDFPGNQFPENDFQEEDNSLNESGLTKSVQDSLTVSINSSNPTENQNPSQNEINHNNNNTDNNDNNDDEHPKAKRRGRKPKKPVPAGVAKSKGGYKRPRGFHIYDDDLLITAIMKNKDFNSSEKFVSCSNSTQNPKKKYKMRALRKTPKRKFQLALRSKGGNKSKKKNPNSSFDSRRLILARKTVLSWLIATGGVALNEIIQYRNLKNKNSEILKQGWITLEGIQCSCCDKTMSLSEFKSHAGPSCQRSNGNLFLQSGKSFTLCQLEAWGAEFRLRRGTERVNGSGSDREDRNDDTCALCGDGGELLCCDTCPNTYHPACLPNQEELPEGSWYCWHCICQSCGNAVGGKTDISTACDLKCLQCGDSYHDTCIGGTTCDGDGTWFCGISCQEIHQWLRWHVGVSNFLEDGVSWSVLRWSEDESQKVQSSHKTALMAECNTKLAVGLTLMEECFAPMLDPTTGLDMIPHLLYNRGSNFARLDYKGFYTVVLEKGDDIVSVASLRIHGNRIAEMPLVVTNTEYRRQGMCRRLLDTIERMLRSFRVKLLVLSAIPDLVETWVSGFGFKPIQENEKSLLHNITLMLFPGSSILTKNLVETETHNSGCEKDMYEEESNCHNYEDLNENSNSKLDRSENGDVELDIRTVDPESTEAPVDCQLANRDHSENDDFLL